MKQSEIKEAINSELQEKLGDTKRAYSDLKMAHAIITVGKSNSISEQRRDVARIATELTKREVQ